MANTLTNNLANVRDQITRACATAGRDPADIHIIAVTKRHPLSTMRKVLDAGVVDLGENRIQEALPKLAELPPEARVHLIGQLQSNKVNKAVGRFATIGSVDRMDLLQRIDRRAAELEITQDVWIQINATDEPQKGGASWTTAPQLWEAALRASNLRPRGVMAMARRGDDERGTRATYARVRELVADWTSEGTMELSLGMSSDFLWAIAEGATHLRLGTVLLGPRPA